MPALRYSRRAPTSPVARHVDYLWALSDAPAHARERVLPAGTLELVINLHEDEFRLGTSPGSEETNERLRGAIVSGAYRRPFVVETRAHASIVGVHFRPGGASTVLGVPAGTLADAHVELEDLWGARARRLRDRLLATMDVGERLGLLERALLEGRSPPMPVRGEVAVAMARLGAPGSSVRDLATELGLSHRRFIELFTAQVGITPKRFARVRRWQRALASASRQAAPDWAQVASGAGYCDQGHLCREWLALTGLSPAEFHRRRAVPVKEHHVAVAEAATSISSNTSSGARRRLTSTGGRT
jgi:AraC-like DNA-binding protein